MNIRKFLGKIKYKLFDYWPNKPRLSFAKRFWNTVKFKVDNLPRLKPDTINPIEIHMLCGHRDLEMGILASWSIMRYFSSAILYVHSDGTLTDTDSTRWSLIVGNVRVVHRNERDQVVGYKLRESCPSLYEWRCENWASAQLVDMHFFGQSDRILIMDSDVLCFQDPKTLKQELLKEYPSVRWSEDLINAYSIPLSDLKSIIGARYPERLCAGFMMTPRLSIVDFEQIEIDIHKVQAQPHFEQNHYWSCQTYYGFVISRKSDACPLPEAYRIKRGRTSPDTVVRHYVGIPSIRSLYFTEGAKRLFTQVGII